ncbi:hypothetical protein NDU88_003523 [Pleurodeles waltl]|uniref:Uncharacterized protein n=1 Tax=Pleurodeles waltl TaxID=8319 RepID=A0AAV7SFU4_PLEWA|nr:hypothetical protein NDU88_003523 [Pleurodeles waltl]
MLDGCRRRKQTRMSTAGRPGASDEVKHEIKRGPHEKEGAASFSGVWARGPRAARFTSATRNQRLGAQPCRPAAPCSAQMRERSPYGSPLFRHLSSPPAPVSRGSVRLEGSTEPAAPLPRPRGAPGRGAKSRRLLHRTLHIRPRQPPQQASPYLWARPRLFSSGEGALTLGLTYFRASFQSFAHQYRGSRVSGRDQRSRPRRSSARGGFQVAEPGPGTSRAARGLPVGGGPFSRQAPISGPAKALRAQPPFLNCRSSLGQRSRLEVC